MHCWSLRLSCERPGALELLTFGSFCGGLFDIYKEVAIISPIRVLLEPGCDGFACKEAVVSKIAFTS